jgi:hypothetical protein
MGGDPRINGVAIMPKRFIIPSTASYAAVFRDVSARSVLSPMFSCCAGWNIRQQHLGSNLVIDLALLPLFALQHSIMARPFQDWWTRFIPRRLSAARGARTARVDRTVLLLAPARRYRVVGGGPTAAFVSMACVPGCWCWFDVLSQSFRFFAPGLVAPNNAPYRPIGFGMPGRIVSRVIRLRRWLFAFWATPTMTAAPAVAVARLATSRAIQLETRSRRDLVTRIASIARRC